MIINFEDAIREIKIRRLEAKLNLSSSDMASLNRVVKRAKKTRVQRTKQQHNNDIPFY